MTSDTGVPTRGSGKRKDGGVMRVGAGLPHLPGGYHAHSHSLWHPHGDVDVVTGHHKHAPPSGVSAMSIEAVQSGVLLKPLQ